MFENKNHVLIFILTGEQPIQAKTFSNHTDTLPSQYNNNGIGECLYGEKMFRSSVYVLLPQRRLKPDNNWESINNLKLCPLNI